MKQISQATRKLVAERDEHACILCQKPSSILHHVVYRSHGGKNDASNLVTLCHTCHAVIHGYTTLANQFPFDKETALDAAIYYLAYQAGGE